MMELCANYSRIRSEINLRDEVYTKVRACRLDIEKSGHLSIVAAVPIPEVIVASSSSSTGQGSFLLSLFLVCVVLACQLTLLSLAVSHAIPFIFLAWSWFFLVDRRTEEFLVSVKQVIVSKRTIRRGISLQGELPCFWVTESTSRLSQWYDRTASCHSWGYS